MNTFDDYQALQEWLVPYAPIWAKEILYSYPAGLTHYPLEWSSWASSLTQEELYQIQTLPDSATIENLKIPLSLQDLLQQRADLLSFIKPLDLPITPLRPKPQVQTFLNIKGKKRHEILKVLEALDALLPQDADLPHFLDLAGGKGHMATVLCSYRGVAGTSLDYDLVLQNEGRRLAQNKSQNELLSFRAIDLFKEEDTLGYHQLFSEHAFSLGLHTCGGLSRIHLKGAVLGNGQSLCNFGCCYLKCDPVKDTHLSKFARLHPLDMSQVSLTLASRFQKESPEQFWLTRRVKEYRYLMHLFLYHIVDTQKFIPLGNTPLPFYRGTFLDYAQEQLRRLGHTHIKDQQILDFYEDPHWRGVLNSMLGAQVIRSFFSRPLEVALLLDRCLYLEEHNYETKLFELFEVEVSPRNIGLFARKRA